MKFILKSIGFFFLGLIIASIMHMYLHVDVINVVTLVICTLGYPLYRMWFRLIKRSITYHRTKEYKRSKLLTFVINATVVVAAVNSSGPTRGASEFLNVNDADISSRKYYMIDTAIFSSLAFAITEFVIFFVLLQNFTMGAIIMGATLTLGIIVVMVNYLSVMVKTRETRI